MSANSNIMTFYAFLWQRPADLRPWPAIWQSPELAEREPFRVSEVVEVELREREPSTESEDC